MVAKIHLLTMGKISRQIGDAIARKEGINPKIFTGYFIRSDGYLGSVWI